MPETPVFKIPTPVAGDPSDAPNQLLAMADTIESGLAGEVRVLLDGTQEIVQNVAVPVEFNAVDYDSHAFFRASDGACVVPEGLAGLYTLKATVCFVPDPAGSDTSRAVSLEVNANRLVSSWGRANVNSGVRAYVSTDYVLALGDVITVSATHNSPQALNVVGDASNVTVLSMTRQRPTLMTPGQVLVPGPYDGVDG